jgi:putative hydrolase of the HAD superfamily
MINAILFDLDDTLYDEMQFVKGGFKAVSLYVSKKYVINQGTFYEILLDVLKKEGRGHTFDITLQKCSLYEKELIPKLVQVYRKYKPKLCLYPDASVVLPELKKSHKLGLITDGNEQVQRRKVQALGVKDFFNVLIFTNHYGVGKQKPNPFPYQMAIKMLRVKPVEAIYVGDNPYKDFIGAKKLGMQTIRILRGKYKNVRLSPTFEADHEINGLEEIFSFIL